MLGQFKRPHTHLQLAWCFMLTGEFDRAKESFKQAADIWDREDTQGMQNLMVLQTQLMQGTYTSRETILDFLREYMGDLEAEFFLVKQDI